MTELMSPEDLADYLGVPKQTIYSWNHRGVGPTPIQVGRHVRYRKADVEEFLRKNEAKNTAA